MIYIFCDDCKHIRLCKHYEYLCRYPELTMFSCSLKETREPIKLDPTTVKPIKNGNDNIALLKLVKNEDTKKERSDGYEPPELKTCPNCGARTYGDIYKCSECGVSVCDCCGYYGDTTIREDKLEVDTLYCSDCYDKLFKDEIEEEVDDSSIFEMLTSDFESESDEDGSR